MSDAPAPLTPPDCDLRGLEWMPLYGGRLLSSETWLMASPEGRCAALTLWWASWQQVPAASLANDDRVLAQLAGYGVALKAWKAIRSQAMRGWVLCNDGRLYHPVVAGLAIEAWDRRVRDRDRKTRWRQGRNADGDGDTTRTETGTRRAGDGSVRAERTGQDRTGKEEEKNSEATPPPPDGALMKPPVESLDGHDVGPPPIGQDARDVLWREGLPRLQRLTGKTGFQARSMLGKFLRDARDDCALVSSILHECEAGRFLDPIPWITAAILSRTGQRGSHGPPSKLGWMMEPNVVENLMSIGRKQ